jgi:hypothetical protein
LKLGAVLIDHKRVNGYLLRFTMKRQLEPIDQEGLQHQPELLLVRGALCLRFNVEWVGIEPAWASRNLIVPNVIGVRNELPQAAIPRRKHLRVGADSTASSTPPPCDHSSPAVPDKRRGRLDRRHLEGRLSGSDWLRLGAWNRMQHTHRNGGHEQEFSVEVQTVRGAVHND